MKKRHLNAIKRFWEENHLSGISLENLLSIIGVVSESVGCTIISDSELSITTSDKVYIFKFIHTENSALTKLMVKSDSNTFLFIIEEEDVMDYTPFFTRRKIILDHKSKPAFFYKISDNASKFYRKTKTKLPAKIAAKLPMKASTDSINTASLPTLKPIMTTSRSFKLIHKKLIISDIYTLDVKYNRLSTQINFNLNIESKEYFFKINFNFNTNDQIEIIQKLHDTIEKKLILLLTENLLKNFEPEINYLNNIGNSLLHLRSFTTIQVLSKDIYSELGKLYMPVLKNTKTIESFSISFSSIKDNSNIVLAELKYSEKYSFVESSICF